MRLLGSLSLDADVDEDVLRSVEVDEKDWLSVSVLGNAVSSVRTIVGVDGCSISTAAIMGIENSLAREEGRSDKETKEEGERCMYVR